MRFLPLHIQSSASSFLCINACVFLLTAAHHTRSLALQLFHNAAKLWWCRVWILGTRHEGFSETSLWMIIITQSSSLLSTYEFLWKAHVVSAGCFIGCKIHSPGLFVFSGHHHVEPCDTLDCVALIIFAACTFIQQEMCKRREVCSTQLS